MAQLKLYTEEQVKSMINRAKIFDGDVKDNFVYILSDADILLAETPIEIPSDEEIKDAIKTNNYDLIISFIAGANWVIKHILNQTKGTTK